jgi:hypothetical protein
VVVLTLVAALAAPSFVRYRLAADDHGNDGHTRR